MYIPKFSEVKDLNLLFKFIQKYNFAVIMTQEENGPFANHLPLLLQTDDNGEKFLLGHLARINPHYKSFKEGKEVLIIFHGPHAYISPSIYVNKLNVPTWNYTAVHMRCKPEIIVEPEKIESILQKTVEFFEKGNLNPWTYDLPQEYRSKLIKAIAGVKFSIQSIEGKFKLSQNRDDVDYQAVLAEFEKRGDRDSQELVELMRRTSK